MKTIILVFLGLIHVALVLETTGDGKGVVKSNFKIFKAINRTMVYYFQRVPNAESCTAVINNQLALFGIDKIFFPEELVARNNFTYRVLQDGRNITIHLCKKGLIPVNLKKNSIEIGGNCRFSEQICIIDKRTFLWDSTLEVVFIGEAGVWTLTREPLLKLIRFDDAGGSYILLLLEKIMQGNRNFWVTNVNGLYAEEVNSKLLTTNISGIAQYLSHSEYKEFPLSIKSPCSMEEMLFYVLILVVLLVTCYILEKLFGVVINCFILCKTRRRRHGVIWSSFMSQNLMNYHLTKYYIEKNDSVVKNFHQNVIRKREFSGNVYDEVDVIRKREFSGSLYDEVDPLYI